MSVPLFGRTWQLTLVPPTGRKAMIFDSMGLNGEPLRFTFQIERTLMSDANKATVALSNLARVHRALIVVGTTLILRAGYGSLCDIVFRGTVAELANEQDGPEGQLTLKAGDGEPYLQSGNVHLSYKSTVSLARVLSDICKALTLSINGQVFGRNKSIVQHIPRVTLGRRVISGPVKDVLNDILHPLGMQWSIQCGTLLLQNEKGVINLTAQRLSSETGLLGIPVKTKDGLTLRSLLLPTVAPGLAVKVVSQRENASGNYRVVAARYQGDTHGADWTVEADCQPLKAPLADYVATTNQQDFDAAQAPADADVDFEAEAIQ